MIVLLFWSLVILFIVWRIYSDLKKKSERHLDNNGYYRNGYGRLVHRDVAFRYLYDYPNHHLRFREYDIHHKDRNKLNNNLDNLEVLTREEHKKKHGIF